MGEGLIPTTVRGYANLAFIVGIIACIAMSVAVFFSSRYRIARAAVPFSRPPRTEFRIYGRWPNNLILYGIADTEQEAEALVKRLDAAWEVTR